jgi:hypothetical protein
MNKINLIKFFVVFLFISSCSVNSRVCNMDSFDELYLHPVNCRLKLPKFLILDSVRYDNDLLLSYVIQSEDSLLNMNCFVKRYYSPSKPDIRILNSFQKQEVEFNRKSKLLNEYIKDVNGFQVGFLKYLIETPDKKFMESRIFFYKQQKVVTLWLFEKYNGNTVPDKGTLIDCIFNSISLN